MNATQTVTTRENVLAAAVAEYARYGFEGARVDRIAERAKVNKRMLYYYFESKEGLYHAALRRVYEGIIGNMTDYLDRCATADPIERIMAILEAYFNYLQAHPEYVAMISWENLRHGRYVEDANVERVAHPMVEYTTDLLEKNNLLPDDFNIRHFMLATLAVAFFYFSNQYTLSLLFGADLFLEEEGQKYLQNVKRVLSAYLKSGPHDKKISPMKYIHDGLESAPTVPRMSVR